MASRGSSYNVTQYTYESDFLYTLSFEVVFDFVFVIFIFGLIFTFEAILIFGIIFLFLDVP